MTTVKSEFCGFELVWDSHPPVTSIDTKLIKHPNEGVTVYRILFTDAVGKSCANVGESKRGVGQRLAEHIDNDDPTHLAQARMRGALLAGNPLLVQTLSTSRSKSGRVKK